MTAHLFLKHTDCRENFCNICDGGLQICTRCNQAEGELEPECPAAIGGYELILTIHDETVCEAPDRPEFNGEHLSSLLATNPPWAEGLPLAASGFECYVFKKG